MPTSSDQKPDAEQRTERGYRVRQVTHYQPSWKEKERSQPGGFYIQLILDHGVEEYVLEPEVNDADVLLKMLALGGYIGFDVDRKVLMFPNCSTK